MNRVANLPATRTSVQVQDDTHERNGQAGCVLGAGADRDDKGNVASAVVLFDIDNAQVDVPFSSLVSL